MWRHYRHILNSLSIFSAIAIAFFVMGISTIAYADVCVWRNPERTMTKIFPDAGDYKTITKIISEEKRKTIEERLGGQLAAGESKDWIYYEITGKRGETLGYIIADAEKGEYGVIEIVMGIFPNGKVKEIYIQRSSEKDKEFKSKEFLEQFIGKTIKDPVQIGGDIKTGSQSTAVKAVMLGIRKMLIFYDELGKEK